VRSGNSAYHRRWVGFCPIHLSRLLTPAVTRALRGIDRACRACQTRSGSSASVGKSGIACPGEVAWQGCRVPPTVVGLGHGGGAYSA